MFPVMHDDINMTKSISAHNSSKIQLPHYWLIPSTLKIYLRWAWHICLLHLFIPECSTCQNEGIWWYSFNEEKLTLTHLPLIEQHIHSKVLYIIIKMHYTCNNDECNYFPRLKLWKSSNSTKVLRTSCLFSLL